MNRQLLKWGSLSVLIVAAIVVGWVIYNEPGRTYRRSQNAQALFTAMEKLPLGTSREVIEAQLGETNQELDSNMMNRFKNSSVIGFAEEDVFVAYKLGYEFENYDKSGPRQAAVLRYRNGLLAGRSVLSWTPNFTIGVPVGNSGW
jgi:hypothetical protein